MNWGLLATLVITVVLAVGGWFAGHALAAKRDRSNKIRDLRVGYLIEAYRRMEWLANRENPFKDEENRDKFESAAADIQLFGSPHQVELIQAVGHELGETQFASTNALLEELRSDLRDMLGLEEVPKHIVHIRVRPLTDSNLDRTNRSKSANKQNGAA